jgi:hypothetical protein
MIQDVHPKPRWWLLYLSLPLAGGLFWLIERSNPNDFSRRLLQLGAVLVVFGYIELWRRANIVALLHYPLEGQEGQALYRASEFIPRGYRGPAQGRRPALAYSFYSELFTAPVRIAELSPPGNVEAFAEQSDERQVAYPDRR